MKIKLVVITVDEKRRKYIEKQLEDLGIVKNFDIDYFEGFTPSNSKEYINYKDKNKPESDETLCCFRSYFAIFNFNKYSKSDSEDNYDYIITIEDDISIILSDFKDKIDNVINLWKNHPEIEYISLGYLLSFDISEIKNFKHDEDLYYDISSYDKLWGCQMLIFKRETLNKLSKFHKSTSQQVIELINQVIEKKDYHTLKYPRIQIDAILPLLCKYGMIYPPLSFETPNIKSDITGRLNTQNNYFKNHPDIDTSLYYDMDNKKPKNPNSEIKIGVSFSVPNDPLSMFCNGHRQNVLYFFEVLYLLGFDTYLIINKPVIKDIYGFDYEKYKSILYNSPLINDIKFDIVFQIGLILPAEFLRQCKKKGVKLVSYKFSNDYIFDMEQVLFSSRPTDLPQYSELKGERIFDQIWGIPQMENTNFHYWRTLYKCPVIIAPFIWSNISIDNICKNSKNCGIYKPKNKVKSLAIFEPNINVFKFAFPAVLVCENAYESVPDKIKHVYITNTVKYKPEIINNNEKVVNITDIKADKIVYINNCKAEKMVYVADGKPEKVVDLTDDTDFDNIGKTIYIIDGKLKLTDECDFEKIKEKSKFNQKQFSRMTYALDLYRDKKLSVESRYPTLLFMISHADIAISHQWENPLNYLYLELAWMGWPVVHNAHLCKDIGYYYEGFNYEQGGKVLQDVIETHDNNYEYYLKKNRKILDKYLPSNSLLQEKYQELIDKLLN